MSTAQWISECIDTVLIVLFCIDLDSEFPIINEIARQLRQCYICTARSTGCGEYLDPHHAYRYIQPCTSSCILFRNPNDHHRQYFPRHFLDHIVLL